MSTTMVNHVCYPDKWCNCRVLPVYIFIHVRVHDEMHPTSAVTSHPTLPVYIFAIGAQCMWRVIIGVEIVNLAGLPYIIITSIVVNNVYYHGKPHILLG